MTPQRNRTNVKKAKNVTPNHTKNVTEKASKTKVIKLDIKAHKILGHLGEKSLRNTAKTFGWVSESLKFAPIA